MMGRRVRILNRNPKDLWTGALFIAVGLAAVYFAQNQPIGTAMRMGPAYFPTMLGLLLALIGIALVVRSFLRRGLSVGTFALGKVAWIVGSILLFGLLLRGMGLVVAIIIIVVMSAYASEKFRWPVALLLAVGIAVSSAIVFIVLLGIPIPIIGTWIGG
jgi:hypothetical protein